MRQVYYGGISIDAEVNPEMEDVAMCDDHGEPLNIRRKDMVLLPKTALRGIAAHLISLADAAGMPPA